MSKMKFLVNLSLISFLLPYFSYSQDNIDVALDNLTQQINQYMVAQQKTKIAIIPFYDLQKQETTLLGSYMAEELTTNLFMTGKFKIVERSLLKQVLDELKLSQTGIVDPNSAQKLGKMAGVDAIIAGTITDLGTYVAVNCRLIETETGEVFAAAKAKIKKDASIIKITGEITEAKKSPKEIKDSEFEEEREKIIHFKNRIFYGKSGYESVCQVELTSLRVFPEREIKFDLLYKNISDGDISIMIEPRISLRYGKSETYISDKLGNRYSLLSLSGVPDRTKTLSLPPGISIKVVFKFPPVKEKVDAINFVSTHIFMKATRGVFYRTSDIGKVIFRNVKLK